MIFGRVTRNWSPRRRDPELDRRLIRLDRELNRAPLSRDGLRKWIEILINDIEEYNRDLKIAKQRSERI